MVLVWGTDMWGDIHVWGAIKHDSHRNVACVGRLCRGQGAVGNVWCLDCGFKCAVLSVLTAISSFQSAEFSIECAMLSVQC